MVLTCGDFDRDPADLAADLAAARQADLVAVEDVHRLSDGAVEAVVQLVDRALARQTSWSSPRPWGRRVERLPARLTSRLAGGLIVGLETLGPASRLDFLKDRVARKGFLANPAVLDWLATSVGGSGPRVDRRRQPSGDADAAARPPRRWIRGESPFAPTPTPVG